jgi:hypothetical protein
MSIMQHKYDKKNDNEATQLMSEIIVPTSIASCSCSYWGQHHQQHFL